jgi:hypothetical protein
MADRFVTVASYVSAVEAQMAKNFLEAEGIHVFLAGAMTAETLVGLGDEVHLQVRQRDARRAVSLLAIAAAEASLDDDWETQAEQGAGVWTCPLCGTPVSKNVNVCPACQTPNESITTDRRDTWAGSSRPREVAAGEKPSEQVQGEAPRPAPRSADEKPEAAPAQGAGCAVVVIVWVALKLWLLW